MKGFYSGSSTPSLIPPKWQENVDFALNIETATHFPKPDPFLYASSTGFWGNLTIKGQLPMPGDEIGVFDGDGNVIGHFLFTKPDKYGVMHVYGSPDAISNRTLTFKIWEKTTSTEYTMNNLMLRQGNQVGAFITSPISPVFTENASYALDIEVPLEAVSQFVLPLKKGWNFVSIPIEPIDPSIENVLRDVSTTINLIWSYNNETKSWQKYRPSGTTSNDLTELKAKKGYWIYMDNDGIINIMGQSHLILCFYTRGGTLSVIRGQIMQALKLK